MEGTGRYAGKEGVIDRADINDYYSVIFDGYVAGLYFQEAELEVIGEGTATAESHTTVAIQYRTVTGVLASDTLSLDEAKALSSALLVAVS